MNSSVELERVKLVIKESGCRSNRDFANKIGVSPTTIQGMFDRGTKPGFEVLEKIINTFPFINANWLLTGEGEMKKEGTKGSVPKSAIKMKDETRPRVPYDAAAGSLSMALDGVTMENCEQIPVVKAFARYDYSILARGESMDPELHSGDELFCQSINHTRFVQWGRIHVLDTAQGIVVKRVFDDGDCLLCKSDFEDKYPDFRIPKEEVYNIGLVVGMIRRY